MKMSLTQKILAKQAGLDFVEPGQLITVSLDLVLANDITAPVAIQALQKNGITSIFDKEKVALVLDHFVPNKDIMAAEQCKMVREFACCHGITHFYDVGNMGIEHALIPEEGLALPGQVIIGADSHTCTYGAVGAFSTGVGSTDFAVGMATGKLWFKVPSAMKINLKGRLLPFVTGKDVILSLIGKIGVDGALYRSLEFCGSGVCSLSMDDRFTICNMAVEAGAKNGIFEYDETTESYIHALEKSLGRKLRSNPCKSDVGYKYEKVMNMDLQQLQPTIALPHLPSNTISVQEAPDTPIDQVVIGSCTNGRISDLRQAASVLKGKKVAKNVRTIIIPATNRVYMQALQEGLLEIFLSAGAVVSTPTCGPCLGGYMGILAEGERAVATTNRNFVGRMGHAKSEVYLASPYTAAAAAVTGKLNGLNDLMEEWYGQNYML